MENSPFVSNDKFHNFLSYDDLPGILVPQKVYLDPTLHQEPKDVRHFATFYRHKILGVTLSPGPGATLGVSLEEALNFGRAAMSWKPENNEPSLEPLGCFSLKFVLKWPGCDDFVPGYTVYHPNQSLWSASRLVHEVAWTVRRFYQATEFENHVDEGNPALDWTPDRIPYDKLYLLELRQVSQRVFQPVLCYDAD